jgi:hypothetical protein
MKSLIKSKKGALSDLFLFMAIAFIIIMFSVIMYYVGTKTYTELLNKSPVLQSALGNDGNATEIINTTMGQVVNAYQSLKWITTMLIFGFALTILLTNFLVKTNPIWFVPYLIIVIIAVIVSAPMSNTYETIYTNPLLAESFSGFWGATFIFLHLPIWISVIGIIAGILMFINVIRDF